MEVRRWHLEQREGEDTGKRRQVAPVGEEGDV